MKKQICLFSRRLYIAPMTVEELDRKVLLMESGELRDAYQQMLTLCRKHPEHILYCTPWKICLKDKDTVVGDLGFKGPPEKGIVELGYGMEPEYEGRGYMTEAAEVIIQWAFAQKGVTAVEAETEPENAASQRVLEKLGFRPCGTGEEGPRFARKCSKLFPKLFVKFTHILYL